MRHYTHDSVWAIQFIVHLVYICSRCQFCILGTVHIKIEYVSGGIQHLGWHWPTLNVTENEVYELLGVHFLRSMLRNGTHTCGNPGPYTLPEKQRHTFFTYFLRYIHIIGKQVYWTWIWISKICPVKCCFWIFCFSQNNETAATFLITLSYLHRTYDKQEI